MPREKRPTFRDLREASLAGARTNLLTIEEIYRFDGTNDFTSPAIRTAIIRTATTIAVTDAYPPAGKCFHCFGAELR